MNQSQKVSYAKCCVFSLSEIIFAGNESILFVVFAQNRFNFQRRSLSKKKKKGNWSKNFGYVYANSESVTQNRNQFYLFFF